MLDDDGNPLSDEPETSTEKLRRLRYEAQELEEQLEAEAAERARTKRAASTPSHEDEVEESEYESTDDLPRRDDADKTKPPPSRRRRKKPLADENGELSPAVLLRQLKRMRNDLEALSTSDAYSAGEGSVVEPSNEARSKELLRKLSKIGSHSASGEQHTYVAASHAAASNGSNSLSQLDRRIDLLEKYVGNNEADIDEVRLPCVCNWHYRARNIGHADSSTLTGPSITAALACQSGALGAPVAAPHTTAASRYHLTASQNPRNRPGTCSRGKKEDW